MKSTIPLLLAVILGACDCTWWQECNGDDFRCRYDTIGLNSGETKVVAPPICEPWDTDDAVHTVETRDTTIVTATMDGRLLTLIARTPGETHVHISSTVETDPNTGTFSYHVIVYPIP